MTPTISQKNLPVRLPIDRTIIGFLLLDRFSVPDWCWGAYLAFCIILWIATIFIILQQYLSYLNKRVKK